jgi:phosphate/sulfate permease
MPSEISEEKLYRQAKKRVEVKKGFYVHLGVYGVVNLMLIVIWVATGRGYPWFIWPLGGWGIAIVLHFLVVFVFNKPSKWEQRAIGKETERLRKKSK